MEKMVSTVWFVFNGLRKENCKTKVALLLHFLGEEDIKIYDNFKFAFGKDGTAREDKNDLQAVLDRFKSYCNPRKNTVTERYTFLGHKAKIRRNSRSIRKWIENKSEKLQIWESNKFDDKIILLNPR